jgi:iron(III) transport system permease protein
LPMANLIAKAGWEAHLVNGLVHRSWSFGTLLQSVSQIGSFGAEFWWSFQLSAYSTALSFCLVSLLVRCSVHRWSNVELHRWTNGALLGAMAFLLALPGPMVNLMVIHLLSFSKQDWLNFLADRTLAGPIVALQSRSLPVVFFVLWIANERFSARNEQALRIDLGLSWASRSWIRMKAIQGPCWLASIVSFFICFADLSSYLLVQPPGVTTVAMRMFDMLHYGVKNQEAALAMTLAGISMATTMLIVRQCDI